MGHREQHYQYMIQEFNLELIHSIDSKIIHPRLYTPYTQDSLVRPPHTKKENHGSIGTAYIVLESNTGLSSTLNLPVRVLKGCEAACINCFLIRGGDRPDYTPSVEESIWMKSTLENKGINVILTGAEALSLPDHFSAGLFNEKPYLLSSGVPIVVNPKKSLELIAMAGIQNIQMSLHGGVGTENIFKGVDSQVVIRAVEAINEFNRTFKTFVGVVLNVTVSKHNLLNLEEIAQFVLGELNCDGIRFNRHKAAGNVLPEQMLSLAEHEEFYKTVALIRQKYPKERTGKMVSVSGDFGKLKRPVGEGKTPYECPAGLPGGEITIVPSKDGRHRVYSCLEVREKGLQMGYFFGNDQGALSGKISLHTGPFENLKKLSVRQNLGLSAEDDGCIAYTITKGDLASDKVRLFLGENLNPDTPDLVI